MTSKMVNITRFCSLKMNVQVYLTTEVLESCVHVSQSVYDRLGIHPADRADMLIHEVKKHIKEAPNDKPMSFTRYPSDGDELSSISADLTIKPFFDENDKPALLIGLATPLETTWESVRVNPEYTTYIS